MEIKNRTDKEKIKNNSIRGKQVMEQEEKKRKF